LPPRYLVEIWLLRLPVNIGSPLWARWSWRASRRLPVSGLGCEAGRIRRSHPNARAMGQGSGADGAGAGLRTRGLVGGSVGRGVGTGPTAGETGPPVAAAVRATAANLTIYSAPAVQFANFR